MSTTKKRINISLPKDIEQTLEYMAERDKIPAATKAVYLIKIAIELDEDGVLNDLAGKRDKKGAKFVSHKDAWL
jgi:predicted DNA-binding protein